MKDEYEYEYEAEAPSRAKESVDDGGDRPGAGLMFTRLDTFVGDYLAAVVERRLSNGTLLWCPEWWQHPEAIARLTSVWRAFEHLRGDPALGLSTWWLNHADPHLRHLMDPDYGPFAACDPNVGHTEFPLGPLPVSPAPPGMWNHPAFDATLTDEDNGGA
ncbi:DUF4913 domain-containing protein [Yinghuangia sp. ASG 101]|uniref:DUF4913 domain-containing protein n=1 Tax=Yinghuangia sp. ASG 101 TaxID=2896848 RepID=UPI001E5DA59F|nr:DUF4913 domain-containing protein [Yinghuangia sp. ASG 101]UGQ13505.1 DUF4913 domain-containing protein [Yinghuangia sp. ASG 101]